MPRYVLVALWSLVVLMGTGLLIYKLNNQPEQVISKDGSVDVGGNSTPINTIDGRHFANTPWNHLPDVDRFILTDQTGEPFDSAELHGKSYVVSFFFAGCPSFCRDLNNELARVNTILNNTDIRFLTITVDPDNDSTDVLESYAAGYDAVPQRWAFLRGEMKDLVRVGQRMFDVVVDRDTHTDNILLVDKWGRFRDRFKWDQPDDMKRFIQVARKVAAETEPPLDQIIKTRNVRAGSEPENLGNSAWLRDFHLVRRDGSPFFSRELAGQVWLAHFSPRGIGNDVISPSWLKSLQNEMANGNASPTPKLINLAIDFNPNEDKLPSEDWVRFTCNWRKLARIGRECFGLNLIEIAENGEAQISQQVIDSVNTTLFVVDKWGRSRERIDVSTPNGQARLEVLIKTLQKETIPPKPTFGFSVDK